MKNLIHTILIPVIAGALVCSCGNKGQNTDHEVQEVDSILRQDTIKEQIHQFVHIFPSQIKVARLFKNAGLPYQAAELIPVEASGQLVEKEDKALAMGLYGVDMVYSAMNNQTQTAMGCLKISKDLAKDLGLEGIYESNNYIKKFESNLNNQDSLELIIRDLFAETDAFLKDNNKLDLTLLTFAGGWTESVYLASTYALSTKNKGIIQLIGDQLVSLDPLIDLLKKTNGTAINTQLITELNDVRTAIKAGIVKEETDLEPMVIQMDDEKIKNLIAKLDVIRNRISKSKS